MMSSSKVRVPLKAVCMAAVLVVAFSALPAHSSTEKRVLRIPYEGFRGVALEGTTIYPTLPGSPSITVEAQPGERHLRVQIIDDFGEDVRAVVWHDANRDWTPEETYDICGRSKRIRVEPGARIGVDLFVGACPGGATSIVTQGTVIATFTP